MAFVFSSYYLKARILFLSHIRGLFLRRSLYMEHMKDELLNMPRRRNVEEVQGEPESRLLLLRCDGPALVQSENGTISGLSTDALSLIREKGGELKTHSLKVILEFYIALLLCLLLSYILIYHHFDTTNSLLPSLFPYLYMCISIVVFMACFPTCALSILLD